MVVHDENNYLQILCTFKRTQISKMLNKKCKMLSIKAIRPIRQLYLLELTS